MGFKTEKWRGEVGEAWAGQGGAKGCSGADGGGLELLVADRGQRGQIRVRDRETT